MILGDSESVGVEVGKAEGAEPLRCGEELANLRGYESEKYLHFYCQHDMLKKEKGRAYLGVLLLRIKCMCEAGRDPLTLLLWVDCEERKMDRKREKKESAIK